MRGEFCRRATRHPLLRSEQLSTKRNEVAPNLFGVTISINEIFKSCHFGRARLVEKGPPRFNAERRWCLSNLLERRESFADFLSHYTALSSCTTLPAGGSRISAIKPA